MAGSGDPVSECRAVMGAVGSPIAVVYILERRVRESRRESRREHRQRGGGAMERTEGPGGGDGVWGGAWR